MSNNRNTLKPVYIGINVVKGGFFISVKDKADYKKTKFVEKSSKSLNARLFSWLYNFAAKNKFKIISAGIVGMQDGEELAADLWLKQDIVVYLLDLDNKDDRKVAAAAAAIVADKFDGEHLAKVRFNKQREVEVSKLVSLGDYEFSLSKKDFALLLKLARKFKKLNGQIDFFSSTPQGGGVALMRHALIRFYRLLGINAHWYVISSKKKIFNITKKKFHNILQGISNNGGALGEKDKEEFEAWSKRNVEKFRAVFEKSKVIVIDDPQPSGMIPYIKKINPQAKIIYRSHIQLDTKLMSKTGTPQNKTWKYLSNNIKKADVFVSHPIREFIPRDIDKKKTVLMPACTDNLDGLNKILFQSDIFYYLKTFNNILIEQGLSPLDLSRPYIIQIARFDPSKGIDDVMEAYKKLRNKLEKDDLSIQETPQLVLAGHGSIDDPEGGPIYRRTIRKARSLKYRKFKDDIKVALLPANDQILNSILRKSQIALQLSLKEGFEVKVTESLLKGKPVIAYRTGGIPLQIDDGNNGFLVEKGDTEKVADILYKLVRDQKEYARVSRNAKRTFNRDHLTASNAMCWLYLANELMGKGKFFGREKLLKKFLYK